MDVTIEVEGRRIEVTNRDKVLFPDAGITKGDLIDYYRRIAETMLPHLHDRPLSTQRFPNGLSGEGFYEKNRPAHFPDWIESVTLEKVEGGEVEYVLCQDAATLVYLANQAAVTLHVWPSRRDRPRTPDRLIFDLDPPVGDDEAGFALAKAGARTLRELLETLELRPFVMATGSRGLHVVVPLERRQEFDRVRDFARSAAELLVEREPDRFTIAQRKAKRGGRLYLDFMRNAYGQTGVAPYSVRARPGAPVAAPLDWDELGDADLVPRDYTLSNLFRRLGQREDPWRDIAAAARPLGGAAKALEKLRTDA